MSASYEFIDGLFATTGKTSRDLENMADEILALPHDSSNLELMKRGQRLVDLVNDLEARSIGPESSDEAQQSGTRLLVETERDEISAKVLEWSLTGQFTKAELVFWLKKYFAIQRYAENAKLGTEFIKRAARIRTDESAN